MSNYTRIMGIEHWPSVPGHSEENITWSGVRKATSEDGSHWLVKKNGWFKKWEWRPVKGMFVKLKEVKDEVTHE